MAWKKRYNNQNYDTNGIKSMCTHLRWLLGWANEKTKMRKKHIQFSDGTCYELRVSSIERRRDGQWFIFFWSHESPHIWNPKGISFRIITYTYSFAAMMWKKLSCQCLPVNQNNNIDNNQILQLSTWTTFNRSNDDNK